MLAVSFNALFLCTSSSLKQNFVFMGFSSNCDALSQSVDFHRQHVSTCDSRVVKADRTSLHFVFAGLNLRWRLTALSAEFPVMDFAS